MSDIYDPFFYKPFVFPKDPLVIARLSAYALWFVVLVVQWGQTARIAMNPANRPRQGIFGPLLGGIVCLSLSYGVHTGRIVILNSGSSLISDHLLYLILYSIDNSLIIPGLLLVYLPIFLATYRRANIYADPSSRVWFFKKMIDGVLIASWSLTFAADIALSIYGYVDYFIVPTMTNVEYSTNSSTALALDIAKSSLFIVVHIAGIIGILMLNSNSGEERDAVVRTLMYAMLPALSIRAIWTTITTAIYNLPGPIGTSQSFLLADAIIDGSLQVVMIGTMVHLGLNSQSWNTPAGSAAQPKVDEEQGGDAAQQPIMTVAGGTITMGPNGQATFVPDAPESETWKPQSTYPPTPHSTNVDPLPVYQQQDAYGGMAPDTPPSVAPQNQQQIQQQQMDQFSHLPQPPTGYFYQPPATPVQHEAPIPDSQVFQPYQQHQPPINHQRVSLLPYNQPNANGMGHAY